MEESQLTVDTLEDRQVQRHEPDIINFRFVALFAAGLVLLSIVSLFLMGWLFDYFDTRQDNLGLPTSPFADSQPLPPEPQLQVNPALDWQEIYATQQAELNSYSWVDQEAGIVRIPIDRAIELLTKRGLPAREMKRP